MGFGITGPFAWTPAKKIVYGRGSAIWTSDEDGFHQTQIFKSSNYVENVGWSANAKRIWFTTVGPGASPLTVGEIDADGSSLRPVLEENGPDKAYCCGFWAANGSSFGFMSSSSHQTTLVVVPDSWTRLLRPHSISRTVLGLPEVSGFASDVAHSRFLVLAAGPWHTDVYRFDHATGQLVSYFDGLAAREIDFSPDGQFAVYVDGYDGSLWRYDLKERRKTRLTDPPFYALLPRWSPDGQWIAYLSCCDPSGNNVWMVHPDGTQDHPVLPTTLAGYPGWTMRWLGSSVGWSPDATRLGVNFSATSPDGGTSLDGVGIISPDGGEVTPVFINPPGYVCCAAASFLCWSPDGGAVVFSSAHHLPVNPNWGNGGIEPGLELWMISADASGDPTRLTYDYSYVASAAWWAPSTPTGSNVAIVKGDATVTFDTVTAEGSTAMCVTPDVPGPAPDGYTFLGDCWELLTSCAHTGDLSLMLEYRDVEVPTGAESTVRLLAWEDGRWRNITRSLAADEREVAGQTTSCTYFTLALAQQTFTDIPTDFWAFDAVKACVDAGIVKGYPDGSYGATVPVRRDQMAVYISRALAGGDDTVPTGPATATFSDVPIDYWAFKYVEYAVEQNVVKGYSDGTYKPADQVTRDQMAVFIARSIYTPTAARLDLTGYTPPATPDFPDVLTNYWAYKYIEYAKQAGIVNGYPDGDYRPEDVVTRDQMAVYVARAFQLPL